MRKHMPPIQIVVIPHSLQRYDTTGDWTTAGGSWQIRVSAMPNADMEFETAIHEMFEMWLCDKAGISQAEVDSWDMGHPELEDPGSYPDCPYRPMHRKAMQLSKWIVKHLGYVWETYDEEYNAVADKLSEEWKKSHASP